MDQMYQYPYFASLRPPTAFLMQSKLRCNYCYKFKGALRSVKNVPKYFTAQKPAKMHMLPLTSHSVNPKNSERHST